MYLHYDNEYDFYLIFLRGVRIRSRLLRMVGKVAAVVCSYVRLLITRDGSKVVYRSVGLPLSGLRGCHLADIKLFKIFLCYFLIVTLYPPLFYHYVPPHYVFCKKTRSYHITDIPHHFQE